MIGIVILSAGTPLVLYRISLMLAALLLTGMRTSLAVRNGNDEGYADRRARGLVDAGILTVSLGLRFVTRWSLLFKCS